MKPQALASLMRISIDGPSIQDFDPDEDINVWHQYGLEHLDGQVGQKSLKRMSTRIK